ncbi:ankyrin repeat domain-containing protein [Sphingomonas sp.]|uniref:ankyrin repeat domain-containing protein n=1 Tax=Sphingomonas sp. TaxID=28214 RepID=UPI002DB79B38|nr:ankyrin repeat domain-containing protein [Sphingomonas sp.]HEU4969035.1 ankyrin repeat domain-containing protein [Sphingomonas sp.]
MKLRNAFLSLSLLAVTVAAPASAQFSDSYNFLKAVKDRDGAKANELLGKGGPNLVNTPDYSTNERAIHLVAKDGDLPWLAFLLKNGARVDVKDNQGNTPLIDAVRSGFIEGARVLIAKGAQVNEGNSMGVTPLIVAVQKRDVPMARLLLSEGADPAKKDIGSGMSAREYAVRDGRSDAILKLMDEIKPAPKRGIAGPH